MTTSELRERMMRIRQADRKWKPKDRDHVFDDAIAYAEKLEANLVAKDAEIALLRTHADRLCEALKMSIDLDDANFTDSERAWTVQQVIAVVQDYEREVQTG